MIRNPYPVALPALILVLVLAAAPALPGAALAYSVTGTVTFEGVSQAPYPSAVVVLLEAGTTNEVDVVFSSPVDGTFEFTDVAAGDYELEISATCWTTVTVSSFTVFNDGDVGSFQLPAGTSAYGTMQVRGDFNDWSSSVPAMTFDGACTWVDTLTVSAGTDNMKFVPDHDYGNAYGGVQSNVLSVPGTYPLIVGASGTNDAIRIMFPVSGDYIFTLDEAAGTFSVAYSGALPEGEVTGTVAFAGISETPYPAAIVELLESGASTVVQTTASDTTTRAFSFETVANGIYDLKVVSPCFSTGTKTGVTVSGSPVDVGEIELATGASSFSTIQLTSDFTSWDFGTAPQMTQDDNCVWTVQTQASAGTYYLKFATDGDFEDAYGGDESVTFTAPGTFPVTPGVEGAHAIHLTLPADDTYTFILNEAAQTFTVSGEVPVERTSWGAIKARY